MIFSIHQSTMRSRAPGLYPTKSRPPATDHSPAPRNCLPDHAGRACWLAPFLRPGGPARNRPGQSTPAFTLIRCQLQSDEPHAAPPTGNGVLHPDFSSEQGGMSADAIKKAFHATEEEFLNLVKGSWLKCPKIASVGSCCLVGVIADNALYVANLGDSRAVLGHRGPNGRGLVAERLSNDHNVADEEVRKEVIEQHPDDPRIVVNAKGVWRIKGIIQVSRSIGDVYLKKPEFARDPIFQQHVCPVTLKRAVISAEPSIKVRQIQQQDLFVIFASDGLWEQLTDKAAVEIVFKNPRAGIAKRLVRAAISEAARKRDMRYADMQRIERGIRRNFHDDITVVVLYLDKHKHSAQPKLNNLNSFRFTNAPVDIFSGGLDEPQHHPHRLNPAPNGAVS